MKLRLLPAFLLTTSISVLAQTPAPAPASTPAAAAPKAPVTKTPAVPAPAPGALRPIAPPGVAVPDTVRAELTAGVNALGKEIENLRTTLKGNARLLEFLPDVQIFHKAVDWALRYDEFFDPKQFDAARRQLAMGLERANALKDGRAPWTQQPGLVVRGYISRIDGSVQPYGLIIPDSWKPNDEKPMRLDFWLHGRGEKLSELAFIEERLTKRGEFAPVPANEPPAAPGKPGTTPITNPPAIVAHLYERYCNANKFAGELDLFETLGAVQKNYKIDKDRLAVRGFSMGGAGTWQYATHFAGMWAAAAPGAGFAETAEFFKSFAPGKTPPPWWEQVLWRWYDATLYARNLSNTTTVAYSGELDGQKQAADIMARYMAQEGLTLTHLIGPKMAHKYDPETKLRIKELISAAMQKGREAEPKEVKFTTYTLIYPKMRWVAVEGLERHWERTDVEAKLEGDRLVATTKNVTAVRFNPKSPVKEVVLNGQSIAGPLPTKGGAFRLESGKWVAGALPEGLRKQPGLCGPVDHAFMSKFVMVRPTGKARHAQVDAWTKSELDHAIGFWRKVYRGDAPVKDDTAITDADIASSNLVLWGDPASNAVLAKLLPKLPLEWTSEIVRVGNARYPAADHAPILIFPNPLNPKKYVVLNSGVTYREKALLNNSDQTPKLPDWAIVDLKTPPGPEWPGLVMEAGFFDEQWRAK